MIKLFEFLLRYIRSSSMNINSSEVRLLWAVITFVYIAITLEIIGGAVRVTLNRAWNRFIGHPNHFVPKETGLRTSRRPSVATGTRA